MSDTNEVRLRRCDMLGEVGVRQPRVDSESVVLTGRDVDREEARPIGQVETLFQWKCGQPVEPAAGGNDALGPGKRIGNLDNPRNEPRIGVDVLNARIRSLTGDHVPVGVALHSAHVRQSRDSLEHAERIVPDSHEVAEERSRNRSATPSTPRHRERHPAPLDSYPELERSDRHSFKNHRYLVAMTRGHAQPAL
jgi:hypothetical protein